MHPEVYEHGHLLVPAGFLETARRDAHDSGRLGHPPGQLGDPQHHGAELPQVDQPRPAAVRSRDGGTRCPERPEPEHLGACPAARGHHLQPPRDVLRKERAMRTHQHSMLRSFEAAVALLVAGACDTSVTNPGLTPDDALDKPEAWPAIVVGARRALSDAIGSSSVTGGQLLYWGATVSFEINPAGSTGSYGIPPDVQVGILNDATSSADWASSNQARFVPEDAVKRFKRVMPDTLFSKSTLVGQVYLYAGFANRLLGENFCESVIPVENPDGSLAPGSLGSHTLYFLRGDTAFTNAIAIFTASGKTDTQTTNLIRAARAGRASVRADLATYGLAPWTDALADAALVPDTATFQVPYSSASPDQYNYLYWARADQSFRAHTEWGTFYEGYYRTTRDPRVRWDTTTGTMKLFGDAAVAKFGGLRRWLVNSGPGSSPDGLYRVSRTDALHTTPIETMTTPVARALCFAVGKNERDTNPNVP